MPEHDHHDGDAARNGACAPDTSSRSGPRNVTCSASWSWRRQYADQRATETSKARRTISAGNPEWPTEW